MFTCGPSLFGGTSGTWNAAVSALNPVFWLKLGDASGNFLDSSGNNYNGTLTGTGSANRAQPTGFAGPGNGFQSTAAAGQWCDIVSQPAFNISGNVTVMIVIKIGSGTQANFPKLIWKPTVKASGQATWMIYQNYSTLSGKFVFRTTIGGVNTDITSTTIPAVGSTYFVVGRRNGTEQSIFVNGTKEAFQTLSGTADINSFDVEIAGSSNTDCPVATCGSGILINGAVSDAAILDLWNKRNSV